MKDETVVRNGQAKEVVCNETNLSAVKVYFPWDEPIRVHQMRVKPCPDGILVGYYWYGIKQKGTGRPPRWVENVLADVTNQPNTITDANSQQNTIPDVTDQQNTPNDSTNQKKIAEVHTNDDTSISNLNLRE